MGTWSFPFAQQNKPRDPSHPRHLGERELKRQGQGLLSSSAKQQNHFSYSHLIASSTGGGFQPRQIEAYGWPREGGSVQALELPGLELVDLLLKLGDLFLDVRGRFFGVLEDSIEDSILCLNPQGQSS